MKIDRLISILVILLRKEKVQAKELAEMFEVSVRTILRDIEALNLAGIPIVTYQGANGGIGIADGYRIDKSVLTNQEIAAIVTTLKGMSKTIPDTQYEVLIDKFKNILPTPQLEILNSKVNQFMIDLSPWGGNAYIKEKLSILRKAIESYKLIEFSYRDVNGKGTERKAEPYSLVLKAQKWYLYGWCHIRQDFRFFKISRMKEIKVLDISFHPKEIVLDEILLDNKWKVPSDIVEIELVFDEMMANIVEEWFGENIVRTEEGKLLVKAIMPENDWLYGFILSFGATVEVKNPPHIRTIIAEISKSIYEKYV